MFCICFTNIEAKAGLSKVDHANQTLVIEEEKSSRVNAHATREHGGIFSLEGKPQQMRWSFSLK